MLAWIAALTGDSKADRMTLENFLHDGVILCKLINRLAPGAVKKMGKKGEAAALENINSFRAAAKVRITRIRHIRRKLVRSLPYISGVTSTIDATSFVFFLIDFFFSRKRRNI